MFYAFFGGIYPGEGFLYCIKISRNIDPPYNTGNDFVYNDDFAEDADSYLDRSGQFDEDGNRLVQNTESNGRFHTDWLNMIYPRLKLAKSLLSEDGVIFISLDDKESASFKMLCSEIFGESNFLECLVWKKRATPPNDKNIGRIHEFVFVYCKDINCVNLGLLPRDEASISRYSNPDNDPRGPWAASDLSANGKGGRIVQSCIYPILNPNNNEQYYPSEGRCWLFNKEKIDDWIAEGRVAFRENTGAPFLKRYLSEVRQGLTLPTIMTEFGYSQTSAAEADKLFNKKGIFEYAKPTTLLNPLVRVGAPNMDSIILDFFSGSATTAHAVMQLNAEDGGHRKFIMVQLPELTDEKSEAYKAGYKNICEIGKERIRRAAKKIAEEHPGVDFDGGFRVLKLDSSNMQEVYYTPADFQQSLLDETVDNIKPDRTPEDLLFQVMLDLGVLLSSKIVETTICGKKVFNVEDNFLMGIKTLSLFFIDEVAKYRSYNDENEEVPGEYAQIFEEEYLSVLNDYLSFEDTPYQRYLKSTCSDPRAVHKGYFSIDKKTGKSIDSTLKRGSEFSDDISAYDLILKNKERLLSFEEPTRFIFSHSALREGWDNPNVFQICTLKHSDSNTAKRQEVGRGLRLCVNQQGSRMDAQALGDDVHKVNMLTVIASESYKTFVADLQSDIKSVLYDRPTKATESYFKGKCITADSGEQITIDDKQARSIYRYLLKNDYIDSDDKITDKYRADLENHCIEALPDEISNITQGVQLLIQSVFDPSVLDGMISNAAKTKINENPLNDNFYKQEFQTLWGYINHKYAYTVSFDSDELISKSIAHINDKLFVSELQYTATIGRQKDDIDEHEIDRGDSFSGEKTRTQTLKHAETSRIKYDLVGKIATGTTLTRKTVAAILKGIRLDKLYMFKNNPEEFITKVTKLIKEQKATTIVDHITYTESAEEPYDNSIFTASKGALDYEAAFKATKAVQDYVFTDGTAEQSVERRFVKDLDSAAEVCVYAKLPKGFSIPTPVGNYSPDWAIAFHDGTVKHIFFIAETKGTMDSLDIRPIEKAKISCARKLFNEISTDNVVYHDVDSYQRLLDIMTSPELDKKRP